MKHVTVRLRWLVLASPLIFASTAFGQAGGLYLPGNGAAMNGTAMAGSAAIARNAETAWFNPAGLTRLDAPEVTLYAIPFDLGFSFNPSAETTVSGSDGGNQGGWSVAGGFYGALPVSKRLALGLSITTPAGLGMDPGTWPSAPVWTFST